MIRKLFLNLGYKLFDLGCLLIRKAAVKQKADNQVYFYQIIAFDKFGVIILSEKKESPTKVVDLSWLNVPGAFSYKITGRELLNESNQEYDDDFDSNGVNLGDGMSSK